MYSPAMDSMRTGVRLRARAVPSTCLPADAPREWLGPSVNEAAEALLKRLGVRVDHGNVSRSILTGWLHCGWRFFATPDAATDAKVAAGRARVVAALDAMEARVAAAA